MKKLLLLLLIFPFIGFGQVPGCTDSTALNYNSNATIDDGSCLYCYASANIGLDTITVCDSAQICVNSIAGVSYSWDTLSTSTPFSPTIGDFYGGGIVFYLDGNGGGLIAAPFDQGTTSHAWGCTNCSNLGGSNSFDIAGADGTAIGTGYQNTIDIEAGCTTLGIAADLCANYTDGTYSDWFLPSKDELNEMYVNKTAISFTAIANGGGGFVNQYYQSSTEVNANSVWSQSLGSGWQASYSSKSSINRVRAVRAF